MQFGGKQECYKVEEHFQIAIAKLLPSARLHIDFALAQNSHRISAFGKFIGKLEFMGVFLEHLLRIVRAEIRGDDDESL